jgi:uncharacterized protein (TIGR03435 family)
MSKQRPALVLLVLIATSATLTAQDTPSKAASPEFDVVSIKRVDELRQGGGMRSLPDGTFMMMNQPMGTLVNVASPVFVALRDIIGMPDWMMRERYDVTVKPPAGLTREQRREQMPVMWRAMFADRMKLAAHVEQRERDVYQLVVASSDGKLGPDLKPSTLDCSPRPVGTALPPPQGLPSLQERQNRCGLSMSTGLIVSGGITMDRLVPSLGGLAGGEVQNRTGLDGQYALTLRFSPARQLGADAARASDDAPDFFTALREQLGLKLEREKKMMPVFVIDHVERPREN